MKQLLLTIIAAVVLVGCGFGVNKPLVVSVDPVAGAKAPDTSIHDAVSKGNIEAVKHHIAAGTDINAKSNTKSQYTPLFMAAFKGHKEIAELLIANGADVHAKDKSGGTSLLIATMLGRTEVVELLISKGAYVNAKDRLGRTPLDFAKKTTADLLRKHGGKTGAELKAELPKLEIEQSLLQAIKAGNIEAVKQHLEAGTDVNASDNLGRTALHKASGWQGQREIVELLISNGADVNAKRSDGAIPLHYAVYYNRMENAEILLSNGADLNAKDGDQNGATPLHEAAWRSRKEIVDLLISKGADVNDKDNEGQTPLDLAVQHKSSENIKLLRKHGGKTAEELKAEGK
jgi:ankyrin repeat protein